MAVHGTARFAERIDLDKAKLVRNRPPGELPEGLMVGWWFEDQYDYAPIEYSGDQHQLIVAGTGGGKFTTGIAPMLLGSRLDASTVVVVDPKGEIAKLAGPFFQQPFGNEPTVHLLDPWDQCGTGQTSVLNVSIRSAKATRTMWMTPVHWRMPWSSRRAGEHPLG